MSATWVSRVEREFMPAYSFTHSFIKTTLDLAVEKWLNCVLIQLVIKNPLTFDGSRDMWMTGLEPAQ